MALFVEQRAITDDGVSLMYGLHAATQASAPRIALVHSLALDHSFWNGAAWPCWRSTPAGMAALLPFQHDRWLSQAFRAGNPEVETAADAVFLRNDVTCYEAACPMLGAMDLRHVTQGIQVPTTVLVGSGDAATPPAMAENIARRILRASLQVLASARHLTPLERPDQIITALHHFRWSSK